LNAGTIFIFFTFLTTLSLHLFPFAAVDQAATALFLSLLSAKMGPRVLVTLSFELAWQKRCREGKTSTTGKN
jgi:hypothetical protein